MIILTVVSGPEKGKVHRLRDGSRFTIGRKQGDVPLDDRSVSRHHARIELQSGQWHIIDLESGNGTYLNQERLTPQLAVPLDDGDRIQLGRVMLVFNTAVLQAQADAAAALDEADETHAGSEALEEVLAAQEQTQKSLAALEQRLEQLSWQLATKPESTPKAPDNSAAALDQIRRAVEALKGGVDPRPELAALKQAIDRLAASQSSQTPVPDLSAELQALREAVAEIRPPAAPDLQPRLDAILQAIAAIPAPNIPEAPDHTAELAALREAVEKLGRADVPDIGAELAAVHRAIANITPPAAPDVTPELKALREAIAALPRPIDPSPAIESLRQAIEKLPRPADPSPAIERVLKALGEIKLPEPADHRAELAALREAIDRIEIPAPTEWIDPRPEIAALHQAIQNLPRPEVPDHTAELAALRQAIQSIQIPPGVDHRPDIAALREAIAAIRIPEATDHAADFAALREAIANLPRVEVPDVTPQLDALREAVAQIKLPDPVDPTPAIERVLAAVAAIKLPDVPDHRAELQALREAIARIEIPPSVDTRPELAALRQAIENLPRVEVPDHAAALAEIRAAIADIALPESIDPRPEIEALRAAIAGIDIPQAIDPRPDIEALRKALENLPRPETVDHRAELAELREAIANIEIPQGVDVRPDIQALRDAIDAISIPSPVEFIDISPKIDELAGRLDELTEAVTAPRSDDSLGAKLEALTQRIETLAGASHPASPDVAELRALLEDVYQCVKPKPDGELVQRLDAVIDLLASQPQAPAQAGGAEAVSPAAQQAIEEKLDALILATSAAGDEPPIDAKLDVIYESIAELKQLQAERDTAALLASVQAGEAGPTGESQAILAMLEDLSQRLAAMEHRVEAAAEAAHGRPASEPTVSQAIDPAAVAASVRDQLRAMLDERDASIKAALAQVQQAITMRESRPAPAPAPAPAASSGKGIDGAPAELLREVLNEVRAMGHRASPDKALAELFAALRELQWQQEQQADRLMRLVAEAEPAHRPAIAAAVLDRDDPVSPNLVEPSEPLTRAVELVGAGGGAGGVRSVWVTVLFVVLVIAAAFAGASHLL